MNQALSNEHGLNQEPPGTHLQIHPFFKKNDFSAKIYGFFENFFRSKEREKKVTSDIANEIYLEYSF